MVDEDAKNTPISCNEPLSDIPFAMQVKVFKKVIKIGLVWRASLFIRYHDFVI